MPFHGRRVTLSSKNAHKDNATSKALTDAAAKKRGELEALTEAAFDKAYVDSEVAYHKQVNGALETLLIPSAQNADLKALLEVLSDQ